MLADELRQSLYGLLAVAARIVQQACAALVALVFDALQVHIGPGHPQSSGSKFASTMRYPRSSWASFSGLSSAR